ncbi:PspC domain-containing protein [Nocardioides sp. 616]|uniref:PspC domain-containing protein n=1 Tax=Nocardioides sp. 616 TaxID=2268090 RepID=UPI0013B454D0|nr:PspC domain-containing protein [Nocardioides sp. 616]
MEETSMPGPAGPNPPPGDAPTDRPRVTGEQARDIGRLRRPYDRKIAGVAAGLARQFDVDPLVLRIAFVVLAFFGGAGLVLYGALWLLLPQDGATQAPLPLDERSRGIAVIGAGILAALLLLGDSWNLYWFPWPLALLALVVWALFFRDGSRSSRGPAPDPTAGTPYGAPVAPPEAPSPPAYQPVYQPPTRPRDPRKRGPMLFWFTCALVALAVGVLGIVDLAGAPVVDSAYPALALAVIAVMLLVGAFYGRAGGLILLGLVAASVMAGSMATEEFRGERLEVIPFSSEQVQGDYEMDTGELVLDLREVEDLGALDGRNVTLSGGVGRIEVLLPEGLDADVNAEVGGPGHLELFDTVDRGGIGTSATASSAGRDDQPLIELDVEIGVGEIVVKTETVGARP